MMKELESLLEKLWNDNVRANVSLISYRKDKVGDKSFRKGVYKITFESYDGVSNEELLDMFSLIKMHIVDELNSLVLRNKIRNARNENLVISRKNPLGIHGSDIISYLSEKNNSSRDIYAEIVLKPEYDKEHKLMVSVEVSYFGDDKMKDLVNEFFQKNIIGSYKVVPDLEKKWVIRMS